MKSNKYKGEGKETKTKTQSYGIKSPGKQRFEDMSCWMNALYVYWITLLRLLFSPSKSARFARNKKRIGQNLPEGQQSLQHSTNQTFMVEWADGSHYSQCHMNLGPQETRFYMVC